MHSRVAMACSTAVVRSLTRWAVVTDCSIPPHTDSTVSAAASPQLLRGATRSGSDRFQIIENFWYSEIIETGISIVGFGNFEMTEIGRQPYNFASAACVCSLEANSFVDPKKEEFRACPVVRSAISDPSRIVVDNSE